MSARWDGLHLLLSGALVCGGTAPLLAQDRVGPQAPPLHVDSLGSGAVPIVFVAGLGATASYWLGSLAPLAADYRLFLPDPLGFGRSARPDTTYSIAVHAAALEPLIADKAPVVLVGHSLGALVAAMYTQRHPQHIRGLVLIGTPVFVSRSDAIEQLSGGNKLKRWVLSHRRSTALFCALTRRIARPFIPLLAPDMPADIREDATQHTSRASTSSLHDGLYAVDGQQLLLSVPSSIPVLVVHGDGDRTAPWPNIQRLLAERPGWRRLILRDTDHHPILRSPALVISAIAEFADELRAQAPH